VEKPTCSHGVVLNTEKKPNYNGMSNNMRMFRLSADTLTKIKRK